MISRLVVIDTYVVLYNILHRAIEAYGHVPEGFVAYGEAALEWVDSLAWFPGLKKRGGVVLWVEDSKPYWRSDYHPEYKAARVPKPPVFGELLARFHEMNFRRLAVEEFEADDVAAAIVQLWRQGQLAGIRQLYLATVDSDWQGLVCQPDVFWVDLAGYSPRVRQRTEIYNWLCSKWKKQTKFLQGAWKVPDPALFESRMIWDWKRACGDTSDNLPPRSPLFLIDLFQPLSEYRLWERPEFVSAVRAELDRERQPTLQLDKAEHQMSMLGLNPPISAIDDFNPLLFNPVL